MASTGGEETDDFMDGPLIIWLKSCLENPDLLRDFDDLVEGVLLYQVLLQIDPEPTHTGVVPSNGNPQVRVRNLDIILRNIRLLYQEELGQIVVITPDVVRLGTDPHSAVSKQDVSLLLLLLLACAVQCPNKEIFIERIKTLDIDVQHSIVECIKQVTDTHLMVLNPDVNISASVLMNHIKQLVKERDEYLQYLANTTCSELRTPKEVRRRPPSNVSTSESHHLAVELADWKSKFRKQRQELEEKTEGLTECREELEQQRQIVVKLRQEISEVVQEARSAKAYRDELDAMREKAERAEKLEAEVQRFKDKLSDIEFYKTRVQELREDNRVLLETREMVEDQLQRARRRGDHVLELEGEIMRLKQQINELTLERDSKDKKLEELYEEHAELQLLAKSALHDSSSFKQDADNIEEPFSSGSASLSEQLTHNATARALRLELENRKLLSTIESLKESSFHETGNKILELEKDNKINRLNIEQLEECCKRLTAQNKELEAIIEESLQENRKLQESKETLRGTTDKQQQELQKDREQIDRYTVELEMQTKEIERLKTKVKELESCISDVEEWKQKAEWVPQMNEQLEAIKEEKGAVERELENQQKEVARLKELVEEKDVKLDQYISEVDTIRKEHGHLLKELDEANTLVAKLHDVEWEKEELTTRAAMTQETLSALQAELVTEKVNYQQLKSGLEKLGLKLDLLLDPDTTIEKLLLIPELKELLLKELNEPCIKCSTNDKSDDIINQAQVEELTTLQTTNDTLQSENAHLQVVVATLQSQITSLASQHTALQLANSQLVAEKDEIAKDLSQQKSAHEQLLRDQDALQKLHEQLSTEHEMMLRERETMRQANRDMIKELKTSKELISKQEHNYNLSKQEIDSLKQDSASLVSLKGEHSKLKDDFRNLFTACEKIKTEYRSMLEEYKKLRTEVCSLRVQRTELQGEMTTLTDQSTHLQVQASKIASQNEMLLQMNTNLEDDRRSLMEHVSRLLAQYHELLTHSLEDKQHYHLEEKMFADRLNQLNRQKEKLEEKIMDHYRKLESCPTKKKGFGANLVRKVRKAGTELINKSRKSWQDDIGQRSSMALHGSESGGNESDGSFEELQQDGISSHPLGFPPSLNQEEPGTRRAVYYSTALNQEELGTEEQDESSNPQVLVFNKISVIGGVGAAPPSPNHSVRSHKSSTSTPKLSPSEEARRKAKKENSIWYEYGCV